MFDFGQFTKQGFVLGGHFARDFDANLDSQVSASSPLHVGHSLAFQPDDFARLRAWRDGQHLLAIEIGDLNFSTQGCLGIGNGDMAGQVQTFPLE